MTELISYDVASEDLQAAMRTHVGIRAAHLLAGELDVLLDTLDFPGTANFATRLRDVPLAPSRGRKPTIIYAPPDNAPAFTLRRSSNGYDVQAQLPPPDSLLHIPIVNNAHFSLILPPEGYVGSHIHVSTVSRAVHPDKIVRDSGPKTLPISVLNGIAGMLSEIRRNTRLSHYEYRWRSTPKP